jgi:hypothetical protein
MSRSIHAAAVLGRDDVEPNQLLRFIAIHTATLAIATVLPGAAFVWWRVGPPQLLVKILALVCTIVALQFVVHDVWRAMIPDAEIRARTPELEFGSVFFGLSLIPACTRLLFPAPFRVVYEPWIDAVLSIILAVVTLLVAVPW